MKFHCKNRGSSSLIFPGFFFVCYKQLYLHVSQWNGVYEREIIHLTGASLSIKHMSRYRSKKKLWFVPFIVKLILIIHSEMWNMPVAWYITFGRVFLLLISTITTWRNEIYLLPVVFIRPIHIEYTTHLKSQSNYKRLKHETIYLDNYICWEYFP